MQMPTCEFVQRMEHPNALSIPRFLKKLAAILGFPIAEPIPVRVRR